MTYIHDNVQRYPAGKLADPLATMTRTPQQLYSAIHDLLMQGEIMLRDLAHTYQGADEVADMMLDALIAFENKVELRRTPDSFDAALDAAARALDARKDEAFR